MAHLYIPNAEIFLQMINYPTHMLGHFMRCSDLLLCHSILALTEHAWFCGVGRAVDSQGVLLFTEVSPGEYFRSSFTCSCVLSFCI
jgi:hypothetical protein